MLQKYLYTDRLDPVHARNSSANASAMAPMSWKNTTLRYHLWIRILAMVSLEWLRFLGYFWVKKNSLYSIIITKAFSWKILDLQVLGDFSGPCRGSKKKTLQVSRSPRQLLRRKARPEKSSCAHHQRVIALVNDAKTAVFQLPICGNHAEYVQFGQTDGVEFIQYGAGSIPTIIHHNPHMCYHNMGTYGN